MPLPGTIPAFSPGRGRIPPASRPTVEARSDSKLVVTMPHKLFRMQRADPRPVLVQPREFVIVEGLLPLHTRLARTCFDATVYLDPPEEIRRAWKIRRDTAERGYTPQAVLAELERREPESAAFIRPQRAFADIVDSEVVEKAIWSRLGADSGPPACLGRTREGQRTEPLASPSCCSSTTCSTQPAETTSRPDNVLLAVLEQDAVERELRGAARRGELGPEIVRKLVKMR